MKYEDKPNLHAVRKPATTPTEAPVLMPIKRTNVRNALITALAREGCEVTVSQMDGALIWLTEGDPRPADQPESIVFAGVKIAWPRGRETRVPTLQERTDMNTALKANNCGPDNLMDDMDNVRAYRDAYRALVNKLALEPERALPVLTVKEIAEAEAEVAAEPVIVRVADFADGEQVILSESGTDRFPTVQHMPPVDERLNTLMDDLAALQASLG